MYNCVLYLHRTQKKSTWSRDKTMRTSDTAEGALTVKLFKSYGGGKQMLKTAEFINCFSKKICGTMFAFFICFK